MSGNVTVSIRQGPRTHQEDFYFFERFLNGELSGWILAVMDGHRGDKTAKLCAEEIPKRFKLELARAQDAEDSLRRLIAVLHDQTKTFEAGSTISLALILPSHKKAVIAVLGDSPVIVFDSDGNAHVSPEHNVRSNKKERSAAKTRGAVYEDGYIFTSLLSEGLQLSRALGDASLDSILLREPEIYTVNNPKWILIASDGILDPNHKKGLDFYIPVMKVFGDNQGEAEDMMAWREHLGLNDNATALVWHV